MIRRLLARRPQKPLPEITPPSPFVGYTPVKATYQPVICGLERMEILLPVFKNPVTNIRKWKAVVFTDQGVFENPHVTCIDRLVTQDTVFLRVDFEMMPVCLPVQLRRIAFLNEDGDVIRLQEYAIDMLPKDALNLSYTVNC